MRYRLQYIVIILLVFQASIVVAQESQAYWDSLELESFDTPADSNTVINLNLLFDHYSSSGKKPAMPFVQRALEIADSIGYLKGLALSTLNLAIAHDMQGNYYAAFKSYHEALRLANEIGSKDYRSRTLLSLGYFHSTLGNYKNAIERTREAAILDQEIWGMDGPAYAWSNLGFYYLKSNKYDSALHFTLKAYEIFKSEQDSAGLGDIFFNLANLAWEADGDLPKAINYCLKAEEMYKGCSHSQVETTAECQAQLGYFYTQQKDFQKAESYLEMALNLARKNKLRYIIKICYSHMAGLHEAAGQYEQALGYLHKYLQLHDSLDNQQNALTLRQLQNEFELENQQARIAILNQDNVQRQNELDRQLLIRNGFFVVVCMLLVLAAVLIRNNSQKQKTNSLLMKQKAEIEEKNKAILRKNQMLQEQKRAMLMQSKNLHEANQQISRQKETIEKKNLDITDSLNYARKIQYSMLPEAAQLKKRIPDSFVWLNPRDIVSGDFLWFEEQDNKIFIAAVDCTGHGVPGAFMSLIGDRYLCEIVRSEKEYEPDRILTRLNEHVFHVLKQDKSDSQDGMEMSMCVIDREKKELSFAGARNNLLYVQNEHLYKIKGDRAHIGGNNNLAGSFFTKHTVKFNKPTKFYLYTDGIKDQFGGLEDKKFSEKQITSLIQEINHLPMTKQRMLIQARVEDWMKGYEQVDDILMVGWPLQ